MICQSIIDSLKEIGIGAEFKPINDIITSGKKISGNAQTRRCGILLQHGTILYKVDVEKMFSLLKVSDEKIRDKMITNVKERVTSIFDQKNISKDELYRALVFGFSKNKEIEFDSLTQKEIERANELEKTKYATKEWNEKK